MAMVKARWKTSYYNTGVRRLFDEYDGHFFAVYETLASFLSDDYFFVDERWIGYHGSDLQNPADAPIMVRWELVRA